MAKIQVMDQISLGGFRDKANEDRVGLAGHHAWVIDGATGLGDPFMAAGSDAAWLAQRTHEALTRHANEIVPGVLMSCVADDLVTTFANEQTRRLRESWELPCGAFMLASIAGAGITVTWSGDCRALVQADGGPLLSFGATPNSEELEAAMVARLGSGADPAQRYRHPEALSELRRQRGLVLHKGKAMILAPDRGFLDHLHVAGLAGQSFDVLLMTDGFAAAELRYGLFETPQAIMDAARQLGLHEIAGRLRRFEHEIDPDGILKPRWKRSDDATAMWLKFDL